MAVDPDVTQAIEDLLPIAYSMKRNKEMLGRADTRGTESQAAALRARIVDQRADVATRAERIGTTGPALLVILAQEIRLRTGGGRRRPPRPAVGKAIAQLAAVRADDLIDAQAEADVAQRDLERAQKRVAAVREAERAFHGWSRAAA